MDLGVFKNLEQNANMLGTAQDSGFVIKGVDHVALKLSLTERHVLAQVIAADGQFSIAAVGRLHEELVKGFEGESGIAYKPEMTKLYLRLMNHPATLKSLAEKGLVERVPGQTKELAEENVCWQRKQ